MAERLYGYVASDGRTIETWPALESLGRVVSRSNVRLPRWSWVHGSSMTHYRVRLVDGRTAYGRGSPGIAIALTVTVS